MAQRTIRRASALLISLLLCPAAQSHFQTLIPSNDVLAGGGAVNLQLMFTHPVEQGPVMPMQKPAQVGVFSQGEITDLLPVLVETPQDGQMAWTLDYQPQEPGALQFFVEPQPYWEPAEGKFIVHYTKVVVDNFASGEGWDALIGLPVEIQPLTRPNGLWVGNLFSGVVIKDSKPVPFAEIEVEFINDGSVRPPHDLFVTQVIKADANGTFHYAMPKSGWWGFAALLEADEPMTSPDGEAAPVEQGALIWVKTTDMNAK